MNSLADSSVNRSMRLVYDLHGICFSNGELIDYVSESLIIMGVYCQDIALHCIRVSNYSTLIGKQLRLPARDINLLWCASIFHDIGKTDIPADILEKPAKLTKEEYEIVKTHSLRGYELLRKNVHMGEVANIMLHHHERFDGKGYPTGKEGQDIPFLSRIIAVADAFDAMTTERAYKTVISLDSALTELNNGKWTQFDGDVVDCFLDLIKDDCLKPKEQNMVLGLY